MTSKFLNISTDTTLGGSSASDNTVASQKAVKAYADTKQDTLVSGTNIKTVGGNSLLGSGNVAFPTVDQTYSATSTNAQSGVAVTNAIAVKQDTLVSGTNIKTINNQSLLGSGNISISGGGGSYTAGTGIDITNNVISVDGVTTTELSIDTTPTQNSSHLITSGGVYSVVGDIETLLSQV